MRVHVKSVWKICKKIQSDCLHKVKDIYILNGPLYGYSVGTILVSGNNTRPKTAHTIMQHGRQRRRMFLGKSIEQRTKCLNSSLPSIKCSKFWTVTFLFGKTPQKEITAVRSVLHAGHCVRPWRPIHLRSKCLSRHAKKGGQPINPIGFLETSVITTVRKIP